MLGEEIKAQRKRRRDLRSSGEDIDSGEEEPTGKECGTSGSKKKSDGKGGDKDGNILGMLRLWGRSPMVGVPRSWPLVPATAVRRMRQVCIAKVCADAVPARAAYVKRYSKPWVFEQNLLDAEHAQGRRAQERQAQERKDSLARSPVRRSCRERDRKHLEHRFFVFVKDRP